MKFKFHKGNYYCGIPWNNWQEIYMSLAAEHLAKKIDRQIMEELYRDFPTLSQ